ncbi:hypothetical protein JCM16161A_22300 [Vulcanisaeta sp. JCM 16161]|uniref:hypothetical protein n=1 Tax=Vulcanisaeta sp. JCM 16161 TaxID=1295372 RepID=UPI00406D383A
MMFELTVHAEQRLRLRIHELRSGGVCIDDFGQEIVKAIEHACNGEYVKTRIIKASYACQLIGVVMSRS